MEQMSFDSSFEETSNEGNFFSLIPVILWQRKWWIITSAVIGIIASLIAVLVIPPTYRSTAILLVESAQLPKDVLNLSDEDLIERRLASILQQITARPDLVELIEKHGLYNAQRRSDSLSSVLEDMRTSISLTPTASSLSSVPGQSTAIAFELSFDYEDPVAAQAVAQDLMDRVLRLEARGNSEQAENTVQFLNDQAASLQTQMGDLQSQIAGINSTNGGVLAGNMNIFGGSTGSYDVQIASLQRDNQSLVQQRELAQSSDNRDPIVLAAEQRLASARAVYAETHPDVIFAKQQLREARELASTNVARIPVDAIDKQIAFNSEQIAALRAAKAQEEARMSSQVSAQARAPLVRQQLEQLQGRLSLLNTQYERVQEQLMAARAGVRAEDERMGERLSVVDPPVIPEEPSWPDRLILLAAGIGGGLGLGFVLAFAIEFLMKPIRDPAALNAVLGAEPIGLIPIITTPRASQPWWQRWRRGEKYEDDAAGDDE
ncbi:MAG: GumC family protein [Erythrobacteraceae bacterium]|jgi:succinoglycan biosynthesis transport protein ExoP